MVEFGLVGVVVWLIFFGYVVFLTICHVHPNAL